MTQKIEINGTRRVYIETDYNEIDRVITEFYGLEKPYESVAMEEWSNDESHTFSVNTSTPLSFDIKYAEEVLATKKVSQWGTSALLDYMGWKGSIEPASYLVHVSW